MAMRGQMTQAFRHGAEGFGLGFKCGDMIQRKAFHFRTGPRAIAPKIEQALHILQGKAKVTRMADEAQLRDIGLAIHAILVGAAPGRDQPNRLIMPDHLGGNARSAGRFPDIQGRGRQRDNNSAFVNTLTLEAAIAAPAMGGESKPKAASGTPSRL